MIKILYRLCLGILALAGLTACNDSDNSGPKAPQTVLVVGDSISADYNYPGTPPWPVVLAEMEPNLSIRNYAKGNEPSSGGRSKIGGALNREQPDTVVIFYGAVDVINGYGSSTIGNLRSMINDSKAYGAKVLLCNILPMSGRRAGSNGGVDALNPQILALASETGAKHINGNDELPNAENYPDGLHPDAEGQRVLAMVIRERI